MRANVQALDSLPAPALTARVNMAMQGWTPKDAPNRAPLISNFDRAALLEGDVGDSSGLHLRKGPRLGLSSANILLPY